MENYIPTTNNPRRQGQRRQAALYATVSSPEAVLRPAFIPGVPPSSPISSPQPMSLTIKSETKKVATIALSGEVDSLSAREFQKEIEKLAAEKPDVLVVQAEQLQFISSAGLRVLIFAKQKMGTHLAVYIVKAPESVVETLEKTGLQNSLHIVDHYL